MEAALTATPVTGSTSASSSPARQQVARSAMWSVLENGGLAVISFGMLIVFARFLTPADFGLFSVVLAVIEVLAVLCGMLFHDALVQRREIDARHWDSAYTLSLLLGVLSMGLCWVFAPWFSIQVGLPQAGALLACASVSLPISAAATVLIAQQRRALEFRVLAVRSTTSRVAGAALGLAVVLLGYGVWGLAVQHVAMAVVGWLMLWWAVAHRPRLRIAAVPTRELLRTGAPNLGALLLVFVTKRLFVIWSAAALGPEAAGFLNLALRLVDVLWAVAATAINQVSLPVMSRLQDRIAELVGAYRRAAELCALLLFSVFAVLAATAPELVTLLFGERWRPSASAVIALSMLVVLQLPNLLAQTLLKARGHPAAVMAVSAFELLLMSAMFAVVFKAGVVGFGLDLGHGLMAALCVWAAREALLWPVFAALLRRKLSLRWTAQIAPFAWAVGFAATAMLAGWAVRTVLPADLAPVLRLAVVAAAVVTSFWLAVGVCRPARLKELVTLLSEALKPRAARATIRQESH